MAINKIGVVGAGLMGYQIALLAAQHGYEVNLEDIDDKIIQNSTEKIRKDLKRFFVDKGKMSQDEAETIFKRINFTTDLSKAVKDVDLVIEAVLEMMELKKQLFKDLDNLCPPHTILASNTSALSITEIGSKTLRQDKVIGAHFTQPVQLRKLLEVVRGVNTSDETLQAIKEFAIKLERDIMVIKDSPGFVSSRLLAVLMNEAAKILREGIATPADIDKAAELGLGHPWGPLKTADMTGVDLGLHVLDYLRQELGDEYRPCPSFKEMTNAGRLGIKTRRGFHDYTK
jgi:3-hydroxybutyryl-CoA dehydrogenase